MRVTDESGAVLTLDARLGSGGEADVYAVSGRADLVAKVYKRPSDHRTAKLRVMVAHPPTDPTLSGGHVSICWPRALLFGDGACVGFLMHRLDFKTAVPLLKLYNPLDRQHVTTGFTWQYLLRTAVNIASAVESIHAHGYVVGDVNESNILATNQALVTLVDCDSMQVHDAAANRTYRCPVGKAEFTPPELQGMNFGAVDRNATHDNFGLGILIFMLLMEGMHPFVNGVWVDAGDPPSIEDRIRNGYSPYAGSPRVKPMPAAPPIDILPPAARSLVERCFKDGHTDPHARPKPSEWLACLRQMETALKGCSRSTLHVYSAHLATCPWCERTALLGQDPFPAVATAAAPKPAPQPAAQPAPQAPLPATAFQPGSKPVSYNRALLGAVARSRARYVQRIAIGVVAAVIGLGAVGLTWRGIKANNIDKNQPQITQSPDQPPTAAPGQQKAVKENGSIQVNAIVLCQGVDAARNPVGAAATFRESDFRSHSLTIHAGYRNTSAEDSTFQVNWHIGGQTFVAGPYQLTRGSGAIILEFEDRVPAGNHSVDILINGALSRRAEFAVTTDAPQAVFETHERAVPESSTSQSTATQPPADAAPGSQAVPPLTKSHAYTAKHKHKLGSCTGTLTMTPESASFTSSEHSMTFLRKQVTVDQDGIEGTGKTWRFSIAGIDVASVLQVWKDRGTVY